MTELKSSIVHRNLETKIKLFGLDLNNLLIIFFVAAVLNLIFGRTNLGLMITLILPTLLGFILHFGQKNKPDGYLLHLIRYYFLPGLLGPGFSSQYEERRKIIIYE